MLLEFSKAKAGEKICCLGTWKRCTFEPGVWKAANLFKGESQQIHFFSSALQGAALVPGDLLSPRPFPGVLLALRPGCVSCPVSRSLQDSSPAWVEGKSFQGLSALFRDKHSSWPVNEEESQPRKVCTAWEVFAYSVSGTALQSVFGLIEKYFIPLCWKLLSGVNQNGVYKARTKVNDNNSENYSNLLIINIYYYLSCFS